MAGSALVFTVVPDKILVVEIALALYPVGLIDRMHTVWPFEGSIREAIGVVAYGGILDGPGMSLQLDCGDIVIGIRIPVGPDGMRTAMTGFAGDTRVVIETIAVKGTWVFAKT